jgi:hypothetical protein
MQHEIVTLDVDSAGRLYAKSQVTDYRYRGNELAECNIRDYFLKTYEAPISPSDRDVETNQRREGRSWPGRPRNLRICYMHPRSQTKIRIMRTQGHLNLPDFVGKFFPRRDDPDERDLYCTTHPC